MSHAEVYKAFRQYFPTYVGENIAAWFPNGRNSIRVREANGDEFIFSFNNGKDWKFETMESPHLWETKSERVAVYFLVLECTEMLGMEISRHSTQAALLPRCYLASFIPSDLKKLRRPVSQSNTTTMLSVNVYPWSSKEEEEEAEE